MSCDDPFKVHPNKRFVRLIKKLDDTGLLRLEQHRDCHQVVFQDEASFLEVLRYLFILYATPTTEEAVGVCRRSNRIATRGSFLSLAVAECSSGAVEEMLYALASPDRDDVYEQAFNALIAVYLGSLAPLKFVWPNTYITELGRDTHELDIFLRTESGIYVMLETTRGFDKGADGIEDTYTWHFKKAVFRKWLVERVYGIACRLCYLTLGSLGEGQADRQALPDVLGYQSGLLSNNGNALIDQIARLEGQDGLLLLELGIDDSQALTMTEIDGVIKDKLLTPLSGII